MFVEVVRLALAEPPNGWINNVLGFCQFTCLQKFSTRAEITMQSEHNSAIDPTFARNARARQLRDLALAALIVLPCLAAQAAGEADGGLADTTCAFVKTVVSVLNAVSILVVTIAIIFSGYQIAFAHKRISDVAPVFVGALIIGAASQIAKLFLSGSSTVGGGTACTASVTVDPVTQLASIVQSLARL